MKLFRYGSPGMERPGVLDAAGIRRDLSGVLSDLAGGVLAPDALANLRDLDFETLPVVSPEARLGSCIGRVGHFIAVGLNYADHAAEANLPLPQEPLLFTKAPSCIVGPSDSIVAPRGSTKLDWEVELAIVIGADTFEVSIEDAKSIIAGYCLCHDVSERSFQMDRGGQWVKGKSSPTFGPLGPYLVTPDDLANVEDLPMWLRVNGEIMQEGSTSSMIFKTEKLVSYISQYMALQPGDVITTGTPAGVGMAKKPPRYLRVGDVVELGIAGLGEQRQEVVAPRD